MTGRFSKKVFIIAEAGVNHNGSLKTALKMVDLAKKAGCDAVKFQTFRAENIVSASAPKTEYQKKTTGKKGTQLDILKKLELSPKDHKALAGYCRKKKIMFMSTPFDLESVDLLNNLGIKIFKIPSGELTNMPYLRKIGRLKKEVIVSTGMADLKEIKEALNIIKSSGTPKKNITILHCNTEYPTSFKDVNLRAMITIRDKFKVDTGYSDHTLGIEVPIAAAALGAKVIEKHFTLDRNMKGPDHKASLEPGELKEMVAAIRNIESSMGSKEKKASVPASKNRKLVLKSIVASKDIRKGESFSGANITTKRPGNGLSPMKWDKVVGSKAKRNFTKGERITI
ncbi:N-acetylneuraminate synthase [Candidatus Omnitrophota bacterium]